MIGEVKGCSLSMANTPNDLTGANVVTNKDICKVLDYFRYKPATTLDCAIDTGILRNSITWYVATLEKEALLQAVCRKPDKQTGFIANYYSSDPSLWAKHVPTELNLFTDSDFEV